MKMHQSILELPAQAKFELKQIFTTLTRKAVRQHYYCEDSWYSCPKAPEGCANEADGDECICGADEFNEELLIDLADLLTALEDDNESTTS